MEHTGAISSPGRAPRVPQEPAAGPEPRDPRDTWPPSREPAASATARLQGSLIEPDRRYSEPSLASRERLEGRDTNPKLARSEDDVTRARPGPRPDREDAEDPFPEDVFPAAEGRNPRPQDPKAKSRAPGWAPPWGPAPKAASSGSLDASSDSSPMASPSSPKRNLFARHQSFTKTDKSKPSRELKKHSMSFSFTSHKKVLSKTSSLVPARGFPRDQARRDPKRESQLAGRIVRENLSEVHGHAALDFSSPCCALSRVLSRPGSPPSYQEAIRCQVPAPAACGSQTVGSMRARMLSLDTGLPLLMPCHHAGDSRAMCSQGPLDECTLSPRTENWKQNRTGHASVETTGQGTVIGPPELHGLRTGSKSKEETRWDYLVRRCSQPVFEADQLQYAKESYI